METDIIFPEKALIPGDAELKHALGKMYPHWRSIINHVKTKYPGAKEEWNYPGTRYGWSFRMKDKKRAIIYLIPRHNFFLAAFVFGRRAVEAVMTSDVAQHIKETLREARVYAEGSGIRIEVKSKTDLQDLFKLIEIKLLN